MGGSYTQHLGPMVGGEDVDISTGDFTPTKDVRWIMATVGGVVKVDLLDGSTLSIPIQSGGLIGAFITKVYQTGTTAIGLIVGW